MRPSWYTFFNTLLVLTGVALLAYYALHLVNRSADHQDGMDAFAAAKEASRAIESESAPGVVAVLPPLELAPNVAQVNASRRSMDTPAASTGASAGGMPDMSDWSEQRISDYATVTASAAADGVPEGIVRIPSISMQVPVFAGTDEENLTRGAGRIEGTPALGGPGNTGIAAHRDGYFRALKDVKVGASIFVETLSGEREYRITDLLIVEPSDIHVLGPTENDAITLVTCYPFYFVGSAPQRYIVRAEST